MFMKKQRILSVVLLALTLTFGFALSAQADFQVADAQGQNLGAFISSSSPLGYSTTVTTYVTSLVAVADFKDYTRTIIENDGKTHDESYMDILQYPSNTIFFENDIAGAEPCVVTGTAGHAWNFVTRIVTPNFSGYYKVFATGERITIKKALVYHPEQYRGGLPVIPSYWETVILPANTTIWGYRAVPVALPFTAPLSLPFKLITAGSAAVNADINAANAITAGGGSCFVNNLPGMGFGSHDILFLVLGLIALASMFILILLERRLGFSLSKKDRGSTNQ